MGQNLKDIIITRPNGDRVPMNNRRTATAITSAKQNIGLNAEDTVDITVTSAVPQTYNIGDQITVFGRDYKMNRLPSVKKTGVYGFEYTLQYEGVQYDLYRVTYDLTIDTTSCQLQDVQGDTLTGNLKRFMQVLIANANRVFPDKWALGVCPDTESDKTLTFGESDNCLSVLQTLCSEDNFNVEFEIEKVTGVYVIRLYDKVGQTLPYTFAYGRGKGLYELSRENVSSSNIVTRLKVFGSTDNITSKYRADRLCLPGCSKGQSFIEKSDAVAKYGIFEGRKYFDDIKPSWTGSVESKDGEFAFIDTKFPFDLNETDKDGNTKYLISGTSAKVHFNTGNLAGYDFEVKSYDHATRKFTLIKTTDDRGDVFPSETSMAFQFAKGDEYKVTDIAYSDAIVSKAERELQEEANKYYDQNCQPKVQYGLNVSKAWLENLVGSPKATANVFAVGDYLHIVDADINVDKSVRIKSFVRDVLDPYSYTLTISDTVTTSITNRVISELVELDKIVAINNLKDPTRARNNWRTSRELLNMVFDTEGDYYTEKIKPLSIDTQLLSVGAKSMQFSLTNTVFQPNYLGDNNMILWMGGVLTHYTINEDGAVSWELADDIAVLESDEAFYIYAKCERNGTAGTIILDQTQHKTEDDATYYWFLIGTLSSIDPDDKVRSIALTYGFSMVNGRFIKTGRIESQDGTTYFDLDNSEIGGRIVFKSEGQDKTLSELGTEALIVKNYVNNDLQTELQNIKDQLDGQIEQFFYAYDPTLTNVPASEWTTTELKENHLGDLFYNTESGAVFRFVKDDTTYKWQQLSDSEVAQALALANDALALAKTKRRIFVDTPTTPYEVGDLWVQGSSGDIMRCKTARDSGSYTSSDWEKASMYTDDTTVNKFINQTYKNDKMQALALLDGKIETWFQTTDPAKSWTTSATKKQHVGDLWYNTKTQMLMYYSSSYEWVKVQDADAIAAAEAASQAQSTADGKMQVFVDTPTTPYDIGDLWVDGEELRRCITAKTSGQTYDVNDWVVAVYYDNTKTTIDGGIVTSGTLQVAGDEKSILAGVTGEGTTSDSVRFWAGTSFENRPTAPFRVTQDGKMVATNATVEGEIDATSGKIGGFAISDGKIGSGTSSEQDKTNGLCFTNTFLRFANSVQRILVGCCNSLGYYFNALFELTDTSGTTVEIHHNNPETSDEKYEYIYKPKALGVYGNLFGKGKVALFEKGYIGQAYSDIIQCWFVCTHKFQFESNTTSNLAVYMPKKTEIDSLVNNEVVTFDLEIVCGSNMKNTITIKPDKNNTTTLYRAAHLGVKRTYNFKTATYDYTLTKEKAGTVESYAMVAGDSLRLRYANGVYYILGNDIEFTDGY